MKKEEEIDNKNKYEYEKIIKNLIEERRRLEYLLLEEKNEKNELKMIIYEEEEDIRKLEYLLNKEEKEKEKKKIKLENEKFKNELNKKRFEEEEAREKEIKKIYEEYEDEYKIKEKIKKKYIKFEQIDDTYKKKSADEFIKFILSEYPYDGYENDEKKGYINLIRKKTNLHGLLNYLSDKYNPHNYFYLLERRGEESQLKFCIMKHIDSILNILRLKY